MENTEKVEEHGGEVDEKDEISKLGEIRAGMERGKWTWEKKKVHIRR